MKVTRYIFWTGAALSFLAMAACERIVEEEVLARGKEVNFNVATGYEPETRTSFSGDIVGTSSSYERIDWTNGDVFRVYSPEAVTEASAHTTDYTVTSHSADGRSSVASVSSSSPLTWAYGTNTFFAFYPAPTSGSDATMTTTSGVQVGGRILSSYTAAESSSGSGIYPADMANRGYMYAVSSGSLTSTDEVSLVFHPLMTAFEFNLCASSILPTGGKLRQVKLTSSQTGGSYLAGNFTATLASNGTYTVSVTNNANRSNEITVTLPGTGVTLSTSTPIKVTILGLPQSQTKLSLVLTFDDGLVRTLPLKDGSSWITVPAGQKMYVSNAGVPGWEYHLDSVPDIVIDGLEARDREFSFQSYKTQPSSSDIIPVAVTLEYSETGEDDTWSPTPPTWITSLSVTGTDEDKSASLVVAAYGDASDPVLPKINDGAPVSKDEVLEHARVIASNGIMGSESAPRDLSCYTVGGEKRTTTKVHIDGYQSQLQYTGYPVTANCYVVDRAGWYMFPLVYGNSINAETDNYDDGTGYYLPDIRTTYRWGGNTWAWTPTSTSNSTYYLTPFVGARGDILMPSILGNSGLTSSQVEAVVIWQDVESGNAIVTEKPVVLPVSGLTALDVPYIRFKIDESNALSATSSADLTGARQGNILIGLRATAANSAKGIAVGDILWSWHIWVTDRDLTPKQVNSASGVIGLMPVDLGWCDDEVSSTQKYQGKSCYVRIRQNEVGGATQVFQVTRTGSETTFAFASGACTYQWGRKDPFIPASRVSGGGWQNKPAYSNAGFDISGSDNKTLATHTLTTSQSGLQMSVRLAHRFILGGGKRWFDVNGTGSNFSNLWDANNTWNAGTATSIQNDKKIIKTVYDPCPPGFSVPRLSAFSFLSDEMDYSDIFSGKTFADATDTDYSRYGFSILCSDGVDEIRFPLTAGGRSNGTGAIAYTGSMYYWTGARSRFNKENPDSPSPGVAYDMMVVWETLEGQTGPRWTVQPNGSTVNFGLTVRAMEEE